MKLKKLYLSTLLIIAIPFLLLSSLIFYDYSKIVYANNSEDRDKAIQDVLKGSFADIIFNNLLSKDYIYNEKYPRILYLNASNGVLHTISQNSRGRGQWGESYDLYFYHSNTEEATFIVFYREKKSLGRLVFRMKNDASHTIFYPITGETRTHYQKIRKSKNYHKFTFIKNPHESKTPITTKQSYFNKVIITDLHQTLFDQKTITNTEMIQRIFICTPYAGATSYPYSIDYSRSFKVDFYSKNKLDYTAYILSDFKTWEKEGSTNITFNLMDNFKKILSELKEH